MYIVHAYIQTKLLGVQEKKAEKRQVDKSGKKYIYKGLRLKNKQREQ